MKSEENMDGRGQGRGMFHQVSGPRYPAGGMYFSLVPHESLLCLPGDLSTSGDQC